MTNLKKLRKLKGLSQNDLAAKCGLTERIISYYENDAVNPPIDKLEIISHSLGVSISDLFDEKISNKNINAEDIDPRTLKKINKIKSLPQKDQKKIWDYIETIITNHELEQKNKQLQEVK